jgi:hypothetical protein
MVALVVESWIWYGFVLAVAASRLCVIGLIVHDATMGRMLM